MTFEVFIEYIVNCKCFSKCVNYRLQLNKEILALHKGKAGLFTRKVSKVPGIRGQ